MVRSKIIFRICKLVLLLVEGKKSPEARFGIWKNPRLQNKVEAAWCRMESTATEKAGLGWSGRDTYFPSSALAYNKAWNPAFRVVTGFSV